MCHQEKPESHTRAGRPRYHPNSSSQLPTPILSTCSYPPLLHSPQWGAIIATTLESNTETAYANPARVLLDNKELAVPEMVNSIQDLLVYVQAAVLPGERVLQGIYLDGKPLTERAERESHNLPLSNFKLVELHTRRALDLAVEGLTDAQDILPAVTCNLEESAQALRHGRIEDGMALLGECAQMMDWYMELIHAIEAVLHQNHPWLRQKQGEYSPDGEEFQTFKPKDGLLDRFGEVEQCQEAQDYEGIADILENGIMPAVEEWNRELPAILSKMKAEGAEA